MKAKAAPEYIKVDEVQTLPNGVQVLVVAMPDCDYYTFKKLPPVVEYDGKLFGKTGFNSDSERAYYREDVMLATVVRF